MKDLPDLAVDRWRTLPGRGRSRYPRVTGRGGTWHVVTAEDISAELPPTLFVHPFIDGVTLIRRTSSE
jgi:hypothetical protein